MSMCAPSAFKPFIDWSLSRPQGIVQHVIDVVVAEREPEQLEDVQFHGTLSFFAAPLALPPLWLDDLLGGSAVEATNRKSYVLITIGLSQPEIRVWLRVMKGATEGRFVILNDLQCDGGGKISGSAAGSNYTITLSKGTQIHIPTAGSFGPR